MKTLTIIAMALYMANIVLHFARYLTNKDQKDLSCTLGWFCALLMALNSII